MGAMIAILLPGQPDIYQDNLIVGKTISRTERG